MTVKENISILTIRGLVQGVGFRPFVYRIAQEMEIQGEVDNRNNGVCIRALLTPGQRRRFVERLRREHPAAASIHSIQVREEKTEETFAGFRIVPSRSESDEVTWVSPDIAVCPDCLRDRSRQPHRLQYPFINCTHCGPRFTIIRDLPYDRVQTTMAVFALCPECSREYRTVTDRRFHAQPVACNRCGPTYTAFYEGRIYRDYADLLALTCRLLECGEVIAAKGIGGYHLLCDALNPRAVGRLREIKQRDSKPFAVMMRDVETVSRYAEVNEAEAECLASWRRPIVLLRQRKMPEGRPLAAALNPGMQTVGCLLPYMPIHYDWLESLPTPVLVMTSGNLNDLPIAITAEEAEEQLRGQVPLILHHNREIYNRADDSVLQVCGSQPCLLRRSRGYVPEPFFADVEVEGILAFGAEMVNTFALGKDDTVIQSQHIGDLKNWETYEFYVQALERFRRLFRFTPRRLVCDLHPDYLSSRRAESEAAALNLPLLRVQHHHAHAAACMLEYGLHEPVVALVLDGTGLGDDGCVWGGEFLLCDRRQYRRLSHFEYVPLPGGDRAALEPWRMAVSYAEHYGLPLPAAFTERIGEEKIAFVRKMIARGVNSPLTSSAGRLFDAVASWVGLCDVATRQAEAAILLEQAIDGREVSSPPYPCPADELPEAPLSLRPLIENILQDIQDGAPAAAISARFHRALAWQLTEKARQLLRHTGATRVVLAGGCFQNKHLAEAMQARFATFGIPVYLPARLPCNDSSISAGQLAIAAARSQAP